MCPVVIHILEHEEESDLGQHDRERCEGDLICLHTEVAAYGEKEVDEGEFGAEVDNENVFGGSPHLGRGDLFVLREERQPEMLRCGCYKATIHES